MYPQYPTCTEHVLDQRSIKTTKFC